MSKRIVIASFGSYGDAYPYIGLARALRARGHRPLLAMPGFFRGDVEREGLEFHPVRPDVDPRDREMVSRIMNPVSGSEFIVRELIVPSLRDTFSDLLEAARGADLLITHPVTFAAPLVAQHLGLPWVSTVLAPMSFFSAHDMPVFPPAPWAKRLEAIPGAAGMLVGISKRMTRPWVEPVHTLRRELGLPPGGNPLFEGQHSPQLVLALFSRVLNEPQPDWPPRVRITGPILYNGPDAERPLAPELEAFLDDGPPPIVFTLGTSAVGAPGGFYRESLEAVRRLGARAVLLVGPHADNRPDAPIPDDVLLVPFAPHAALFPRAAAIVHQGGAGTLQQALGSGRPTLVVPYANDQPDNAWRVERLGVSRTLYPKRYTARRAEAELRRLLEDASYRKRAKEVAREMRAEGGAEAACGAIEEILGDAPLVRS